MTKLFSLIFFLGISLVSTAQKNIDYYTFEGDVTEFKVSGSGPLYVIQVINPEKNDSLSGFIQLDLLKGKDIEDIVGQTVKLKYEVVLENYLYSLDLQADSGQGDNDHVSELKCLNGRLNTCTCGDFGEYIDITLSDGKNIAFRNELISTEDMFRGDDVVVYYEPRSIVKIKAIDVK